MSYSSAIDDLDQGMDHESLIGQDMEQEPEDTQRDIISEQDEKVNNFIQPLVLEVGRLYQLAGRFSKVYGDLARTSEQQFLPTPVTRLPTGQETGRYLAIDVGGTNLRVAFIELLADGGNAAESEDGVSSTKSRETMLKAQKQRVRRSLEKAWPIGEHLKMDKAEDLFLWIGDCMAEVVADSLADDFAQGNHVPEELEMGITFSFPMMQDSLSEATLMPMGKGFAITSDLNLGSILLAGYERHTRRPYVPDEPSAKRRKLFALPRLKIAAITNDTVATLAALAYLVKSLPNSRVAMGIIVGTGCNATIPMNLADLRESKARHITSRHPDAVETVVNTEWTLGGAAPPLRELNITTKWDMQLDQACARPGFQPFEYMTGGRYIGELIRLIFFDYLTSVIGVSKQDLPSKLVQEYAITTAYLSSVVAQPFSDDALLDKLNTTLPPPESSSWSWDLECTRAFRKVARAVQTRSAGLIAAAVVGLLACKNEIKLRDDGATNSHQRSTNIVVPSINGTIDLSSATATATSNVRIFTSGSTPSISQNSSHGAARGAGNGRTVQQSLEPAPSDWCSGPEELVVAYTGGIIQKYPHFKETCQRYIDRLVIWDGPQESGKSVFLREASDGGIIGAGVLAGMVSGG
ncbi:hypothetical protein AJ80_07001 [Polytolypa hystricis UAMH7299]|uniref:Phosphotransferase n=1 Tax=Polytolypa hystricis (strain UAMH7299) TaxID=1447883 RepID=A0A2B7XRY4_POLH7|nr:hypothetical protein AJ80_07001 [Polytolypa hystricis UAMH7299]